MCFFIFWYFWCGGNWLRFRGSDHCGYAKKLNVGGSRPRNGDQGGGDLVDFVRRFSEKGIKTAAFSRQAAFQIVGLDMYEYGGRLHRTRVMHPPKRHLRALRLLAGACHISVSGFCCFKVQFKSSLNWCLIGWKPRNPFHRLWRRLLDKREWVLHKAPSLQSSCSRKPPLVLMCPAACNV